VSTGELLAQLPSRLLSRRVVIDRSVPNERVHGDSGLLPDRIPPRTHPLAAGVLQFYKATVVKSWNNISQPCCDKGTTNSFPVILDWQVSSSLVLSSPIHCLMPRVEFGDTNLYLTVEKLKLSHLEGHSRGCHTDVLTLVSQLRIQNIHSLVGEFVNTRLQSHDLISLLQCLENLHP